VTVPHVATGCLNAPPHKLWENAGPVFLRGGAGYYSQTDALWLVNELET
jgi:hypothetical protein